MSEVLLREKIKNLKRKAEQNRQMHFSISRTSNIQNKFLHASVLVGSCATAILTFAEFTTFTPWFPELTEEIYKLIIGLFAGLVFILTILEEYLGLGKKSVNHETIGKQLTAFIRKVATIEAHGEITQPHLDEITREYNSIHENGPVIPDRIFLREKKRLYIKVDISQQIEKTPHMSIFVYIFKMKMKQLFRKEGNPYENERDANISK